MAHRYKDALLVADGACNPIAIVNGLVRAIDEIRAEHKATVPGAVTVPTEHVTGDSAVRLMVHQLAFICGVGDGAPVQNYMDALDSCHKIQAYAQPAGD